MKTISKDDYLRALALFVCANEHYTKSRQFEAQLAKIIGDGSESHYCGNVSDAIYTDEIAKASDFDEGLRLEKISVSDT